ncbi:MAG TPA: hypothetical protein VHD82_35000, partial [Amycolatopsis sp.]|nr:hypothetical protein [Amycolatopsis sp.]
MITGIGAQVRESPRTSRKPASLDEETRLSEQTHLPDHLFGALGCTGRRDRLRRFALILGGRDHRLANVVAYHPTVPATPAANHTVDAVEHTAHFAAPVMMLYPGQDSTVPRESFERLRSRARFQRPHATRQPGQRRGL